MSLNNLISGIEIKLNNLLSSYKKVKSINSNLKEDNANLLLEIEQKNIEINALKDKIKIISI